MLGTQRNRSRGRRLPRCPQAQNERRDVRRLHDCAAHGQFQRLSIRNALDIQHLDAIVRRGADQ